MATDYEDLALLSMIVEAGSFVRASELSGITKSKLSRRLDELERRLAVRLIDRTSRRFEPTPIGLELARRGDRIRAEGAFAQQIVRDSQDIPQATLRISCPSVLTQMVVGDFCIDFSQRYSQVSVTVDSADGTRPIMTESYDVVIVVSARPLPDSEHVARPLFHSEYQMVASPHWLAQQGALHGPGDLENRAAICWWEEGRIPEWALLGADGAKARIVLRPRLMTNNLYVARNAALAGMGMARLPVQMCRDEVRSGSLSIVLTDWKPMPVVVYGIYKNRRSLQKAGRQFLDELEAALHKWSSTPVSG